MTDEERQAVINVYANDGETAAFDIARGIPADDLREAMETDPDLNFRIGAGIVLGGEE